MLIRKSIIDGGVLALNNKLEEMINNNIFAPCLVLNLQVELLEEQDPPNEARLGILLVKEMLERCMVGVHNYFGAKEIWAKLLHCIHDCKQLLLCSGVILLSFIQCPVSIVDHHRFLIFTLSQNLPHCMVTGITHDLKREIPIWWLYDRGRSQCLFDPEV